jgi:hypothetical protein
MGTEWEEEAEAMESGRGIEAEKPEFLFWFE